MDSERDPSISSLIALCVREFNALLASVPNEKNETRLELQDNLGRLRVWIGNFGANRKQTDRLSLDHRLREAPELYHEVRNHINDISEAIYGAISLIQEGEKPFELDETPPISETNDLDLDDSDSDGFWDQVKAENEKHSKLEEYLHDIQYIITSLYKFSATLQNPAHRDRTVQASRIDLDHFEFYDVQHVSEKFNLPRESMLAQRLGKANTKRRQLLAYHKDHAEKISKYVDVAMEKTGKTTKDQIKHNDLDMPNRGPQNIPTKWTQDTTVSTINHQDINVASDSGQTKFSVTTSTAGDQAHDLMPPPPPDVVDTVQNSLFFCPYCRQMIQLENVDEDWNYHVLSDLRPYICTFGNCVKANQLYDSYTEWSEHEQQFHRREWFCNLCLSTYQSEVFFWKHLEDAHAEAIPEDQRRAVVELSERSISSAQQCPLCTKSPISNPRRFHQHLAQHLQQLSLFVLPRPESEESEHSTRDGESNESRKTLMIDDDRESLKSTSTNQETSLIEKNPTLSEGSTSDDQLEVFEVENRRGFQDREAKKHQEMDDDERTMMSGHPSTLKNMANLESISQLLCRSQKAENLKGEVLGTHKNMFSEDHPDTLTSNVAKELAIPPSQPPKGSTSLMPPPPFPRLRPTGQRNQQAQSGSSSNEGRDSPRPNAGNSLRPPLSAASSLFPPPSAASSLRPPPSATPSLRVAPAAPHMAHFHQSHAQRLQARRATFEPGYSPLDWATLKPKPENNLREAILPASLIKVTPSMLKAQNGRRGNDAWTSYQGKVYNISPYLPYHPGGEGELLRGAGKDAGKLFFEVHPWVNWEAILGECLVGFLVSENEALDDTSTLDAMD